MSELRAELGVLSSTGGSFHLRGVTSLILMLPAQCWHTHPTCGALFARQGAESLARLLNMQEAEITPRPEDQPLWTPACNLSVTEPRGRGSRPPARHFHVPPQPPPGALRASSCSPSARPELERAQARAPNGDVISREASLTGLLGPMRLSRSPTEMPNLIEELELAQPCSFGGC